MSHHELRLSDATTGQLVGRYHVRRECQAAATKYFEPGVVLSATYYHPYRCGPNQEHCDAGAFEVVA
jgi:hypothetical protein